VSPTLTVRSTCELKERVRCSSYHRNATRDHRRSRIAAQHHRGCSCLSTSTILLILLPIILDQHLSHCIGVRRDTDSLNLQKQAIITSKFPNETNASTPTSSLWCRVAVGSPATSSVPLRSIRFDCRGNCLRADTDSE
jgi:hypothetical protein